MPAITAKRLEQAIAKEMAVWLAPIGFARDDSGGFSRWQGDVYTYIACVVTRYGGKNRVGPFGQIGFRHTRKIYTAFMSSDPDAANDIAVDLQVNYAYFVRNWTEDMECQTTEELPGFVSSLRDFILNNLYPTLLSVSEPRKVLDLYVKYDETNRTCLDLPGWSGYSSALTALVLARVHEPSLYPSLKKRYAPIFRQLLPEIRARADRLIEYLDGGQLATLS